LDSLNIYDDVDGDIDKMRETFNELKKPYERREIQA
jgi:hypothetical protein